MRVWSKEMEDECHHLVKSGERMMKSGYVRKNTMASNACEDSRDNDTETGEVDGSVARAIGHRSHTKQCIPSFLRGRRLKHFVADFRQAQGTRTGFGADAIGRA